MSKRSKAFDPLLPNGAINPITHRAVRPNPNPTSTWAEKLIQGSLDVALTLTLTLALTLTLNLIGRRIVQSFIRRAI